MSYQKPFFSEVSFSVLANTHKLKTKLNIFFCFLHTYAQKDVFHDIICISYHELHNGINVLLFSEHTMYISALMWSMNHLWVEVCTSNEWDITSNKVRHVPTIHLYLHLSFNCKGCWGTTDEFTSFLHFSLFSTALWTLKWVYTIIEKRDAYQLRCEVCTSIQSYAHKHWNEIYQQWVIHKTTEER